MKDFVLGQLYLVKLLNNAGYKDWRKEPKWPVVVEARFTGAGFEVDGDEMHRIGYKSHTGRYWVKNWVERAVHVPKTLKVDDSGPVAPLHKIRTPKRRNPQAIRNVCQMENGIFRVNGLFSGKARVCHAHLTPEYIRVVPINPTLTSKTMRLVDMQRCIDSSRVSVMCMERF